MRLIPSQQVLSALRTQGHGWPDVALDLAEPEAILPAPHYDDRVRLFGAVWYGVAAEAEYEGESAYVLLLAAPRDRAPHLPRELQVVGHETKRSMRRTSGGIGRRWPTSFNELQIELERLPGVSIEKGSKHLIVKHYGQTVDTLPVSTSDWRAVRNACLQLRKRGLDVSRAS